MTGPGKPFNYFTFGAACTEVEIDACASEPEKRVDSWSSLGGCVSFEGNFGMVSKGNQNTSFGGSKHL